MSVINVTTIVLSCLAFAGPQDDPKDQARRAIEKLERKLAENPDQFDWAARNQLRDLYGSIDPRKAMEQIEAIFQHDLADDYTLGVLGAKEADSSKAIAACRKVALENKEFPHVVAAVTMKQAEVEGDGPAALELLKSAAAIPGLSPRARERLSDRIAFHPTARKPWPKRIPPPKGMAGRPGPWRDPDKTDVWPNATSRANSDPWIAENHDRIRVMKPRLLVINFSNEHQGPQLDEAVKRLVAALKESSRYHGYRDSRAPAFLQYEVFKSVDLRDKDRSRFDSRRMPVKEGVKGFNFKYRDLFSQEFADLYGVPDPRDPGRNLRLDELVDGGYVHELWMLNSGHEDPERKVGAFEAVEEKPSYDDAFRKKGNAWVQAGNGGDPEQPWTGRSLRINSINLGRGTGCAMENLGHALEWMMTSGAIPYFSRYFREYSGHDLKERYGLPVESFYAVQNTGAKVEYPDQRTLIVHHDGKDHRVDDYVCAGGNVHFAPNGRDHYDLANAAPVLSTIEDWRIGSGSGGKDRARPFTNRNFERYQELAADCQGPWLVYWRQNMPGLNNKSKDDQGRPMKNWWPFLFY